MQAEGTLNLLVIQDSAEQTNHLINLLQNSSYTVKSGIVENPQELGAILEEQTWDLALVDYESEIVPAQKLLSQFKKIKADIPVILITNGTDNSSTIEGMRMGADFVVPMDEDQYFLLAVDSSQENLKQRRRQVSWKQQCLAAESRCDKLMDNCKDAIAIVQEGTFVYVNGAYAHLFGYPGSDGMILLPVIDTLEQTSQAELMPYLKPLTEEDSVSDTAIDIKAIKSDDSNMQTTINISKVSYQGEAALQFLVHHVLLTSDTEAIHETDDRPVPLSSIQPKKVMDDVGKVILNARRTGEPSMIFYAHIDQIDDFRRTSGPLFAEQLTTVLLANIIENAPSSTRSISSYSEDTIVLILDEDNIETGLEQANTLCHSVASKTFSVGNNSVSLSLTICVGPINETTESALDCINQCQQVIEAVDSDLDQAGSDPKVYCLETGPEHKIKSEQQVIEFGKLLLEQRLIGIAFQPIAALQGQPAELYEVLMRPKVDQYPDGIPEDFIAKVFKTNVAADIDRWVILESIKFLADKLRQRPETKLFINLSAASIRDTGFTAWLKEALKAAGISPQHIIFQLRELDVGRYVNQAVNLISQLEKIQAKSALTHFGLAINPLLVLAKLPVNFVKIDNTIVDTAGTGGGDAATLESILSSLQDLNLEVIVPFVETPSIMPTLWQHGVSYIQGHYIQGPSAEMNYDFFENN